DPTVVGHRGVLDTAAEHGRERVKPTVTGGWPDDSQWEELPVADRPATLHPDREVDDGVETVFTLPMPSMSLIELMPR
ncbi:MAG: hypothetical protein ABW215_04840, partial [Kibdelosporangium sp.]